MRSGTQAGFHDHRLAIFASLVLGTTLVLGCGGDGPTAPPPTVASVAVEPATATAVVGGSVQLTATTKDASGAVLPGRVVTWASSDAAVATVSSTGLVTGVAAGSATITATSETKSGSGSRLGAPPIAGGTMATASWAMGPRPTSRVPCSWPAV